MKLDRNITNPRRGKYALIKLRHEGNLSLTPELVAAIEDTGSGVVVPAESIDFGNTADTDFFVIRLKDKYAAAALIAYADKARADDPEYADDIMELANQAAFHPSPRKPD